MARRILVLTALVLSSNTTFGEPQLLFSEDFSDPDLAEVWVVPDGQDPNAWIVLNGALCTNDLDHNQLYADPATLLAEHGFDILSEENYKLSIRFRTTAYLDYPGGLRVGVDPQTGAGYESWLRPSIAYEHDNRAILFYEVGFWNIDLELEELDRTQADLTPDAWHTITAEKLADTITITTTVLINGVPAERTMSVNVGQSGLGTFAFDSSTQPICFDDLEYWRLDPPTPPPPSEYGNGGPMLVLYGTDDNSGVYLGEILGQIGMPYKTMRIDAVDLSKLREYEAVLLGNMPLTVDQATMLATYARTHGHLVAMRPDSKLHEFFGIAAVDSMAEGYYLVLEDELGGGITEQTLQYHGQASLLTTLSPEVQTIGLLYLDRSTPTVYPLAIQRAFRTGSATAIAFDCALSIVYAQQGNPEWIGQERDGIPPTRIGDLFYPDYVDFERIHIPQADELKWFLGNLLIDLTEMPIPRTWVMPKGNTSVVIYTGDDHRNGGTTGQFDRAIAESEPSCDVGTWECYRGTSYMYTGSISSEEAKRLSDEGFEIALHPDTGCATYSESTYESLLSAQLTLFDTEYGHRVDANGWMERGVPASRTSRIHCIAWGGWVNAPRVMVKPQIGMGLNADPYHWPPWWLLDHPGFMTGTGLLPRFAELSGMPVGYPDNRQGVLSMTTHMTDETLLTAEDVSNYFDILMGGAADNPVWIGTNFHTDSGGTHFALTPMYEKAREYDVPIVSAVMALDWISSREETVFTDLSWEKEDRVLSFRVSLDSRAFGLQLMLPLLGDTSSIQALRIVVDGLPYEGDIEIFEFKGRYHARLGALSGSYVVDYL